MKRYNDKDVLKCANDLYDNDADVSTAIDDAMYTAFEAVIDKLSETHNLTEAQLADIENRLSFKFEMLPRN